MDRLVTMARFKEPDEATELVECAECGTEIDADNAYLQIAEDYFCDRNCACDYVADRIDDFIDMIVE